MKTNADSHSEAPPANQAGVLSRRIPLLAGVFVTLLGTFDALTALFDLGSIERLFSLGGALPLPVGVGFICSGGALICLECIKGRRRFRIPTLLSLGVFLLGSVSIADYAWSWSQGGAAGVPVGMAAGTAICFCTTGIALLLLCYSRRERWASSLLIVPAGLAAFVALVSSFGYLTGLTNGSFWGGSQNMAAQTALGFLTLGFGILFAGKSSGVLFWSLEWKPTIIFLSGTAILTLASVLGWDAAAQLARTSRALAKASEIQFEAAKLGSDMQDFSIMVRGFGLSDDTNYLKSIEATRTRVIEMFEHLQSEGDATPHLQGWLARIEPLIGRRIEVFDKSMAVLAADSGSRRENRELQSLLAEADLVSTEILELTRNFVQAEQNRIDALEKEAHSRSQRAFIVLPSAGLLSLILVCLALASLNDEAARRQAAEGQLVRANEDLERSNRELGQFAYVASHDLQEPLRMVSSYLQLLERRYSDRLDKDAREFIAFAVDGAERMKALIQALLALSRIGTRGGAFEKFSVEDLLDEVRLDLAKSVEESAGRISAHAMPDIIADRTQIALVFRNLIGNALKFRSTKPPVIHIGAVEVGDGWEFYVRDNGIGIDPRFSERIFGMFQRLHSREDYPGTGIGLAIAKRVVERHGGRIWIEPAGGGGTIFRFTIPRLKATLDP